MKLDDETAAALAQVVSEYGFEGIILLGSRDGDYIHTSGEVIGRVDVFDQRDITGHLARYAGKAYTSKIQHVNRMKDNHKKSKKR